MIFILLPLLLAVPILSSSQAERPIRWSASVLRPQPFYHARQKLTVVLKADIDAGWHLYSFPQPPDSPVFPAFILLPKGQAFTLAGEIERPTAESAMDPNFGVETSFYEGSAAFQIPLRIATTSHPGKQNLTLQVRYQTCNDRKCLPPTTETVETPIEIGADSARKTGAEPAGSAADLPAASSGTRAPLASVSEAQNVARSGFQEALSASPSRQANLAGAANFPSRGRPSLLAFVWLAMGFGALSLLTPCVFPMVPITVSYFTNHAGGGRKGAVFSAFVYAAGIVLTFTALGLLLALIFGAGGVNQLAANPWVNLLITAIFLGFALSLFGAYFIQVPASILNKLTAITRTQQGSSLIGALLMGFTFTLTSFTCTAPFVGTLLVMTAQGNWRWPLLGMFTFSTVFAIPFFVLALAPQLLSQLPKAGGWMVSVKVVMGFLEVAAAMKFLSNADLIWHWGIFTRQTVLAIWIACGAATVLYLFGLIRFPHESKVEHISAMRLIAALLFLAITIALVPGLAGRRLGELDSFLPPSSAELAAKKVSGGSPASEVSWILNNYDGALAEARQQHKLVFIDFTGYTCTNCRWMEANMFPKPEVNRLLSQFVAVRLYTDGDGAIYEKQQKMQQEKFGTVALPLYAIVRPDGSTVATFPGLTRNSSEFISFLQRGASPGPGS